MPVEIAIRAETPTSLGDLHRRGTTRGPWLRLLNEVLELAGASAEFLRHSERPWSSATFSGARHTIVVAFQGLEGIAQGETFVAALVDHEFSIPRHIVADAAIVLVEHETAPAASMTVEMELLLLEDV